jgi:hypothetical protein
MVEEQKLDARGVFREQAEVHSTGRNGGSDGRT